MHAKLPPPAMHTFHLLHLQQCPHCVVLCPCETRHWFYHGIVITVLTLCLALQGWVQAMMLLFLSLHHKCHLGRETPTEVFLTELAIKVERGATSFQNTFAALFNFLILSEAHTSFCFEHFKRRILTN